MADLRIKFNEEMVGAEHPVKADTLNRLSLVEHNSDGTHKYDHTTSVARYLPSTYVTDGSVIYTTEIQAALDAGGDVVFPAGTFKTGLTRLPG